MKNYLIRVLAGLLAVSVVSLVGAAEKKKKKDDTNPSTTMAAMQPMYMAQCPDPCSFAVQSHDKKEAADVLKQHAKTYHNMDVSDTDAEAMVKTVDKPMTSDTDAMGRKKSKS